MKADHYYHPSGMLSSINLFRNQANHLRTKDEVGSVRNYGYKLPESNFTFGKGGVKDPEGAKESNALGIRHIDSPS